MNKKWLIIGGVLAVAGFFGWRWWKKSHRAPVKGLTNTGGASTPPVVNVAGAASTAAG